MHTGILTDYSFKSMNMDPFSEDEACLQQMQCDYVLFRMHVFFPPLPTCRYPSLSFYKTFIKDICLSFV